MNLNPLQLNELEFDVKNCPRKYKTNNNIEDVIDILTRIM